MCRRCKTSRLRCSTATSVGWFSTMPKPKTTAADIRKGPCRAVPVNVAQALTWLRGAGRTSPKPSELGEPGGTRTRDPVLKRHMLYHLSYRP